MVKLVIDMQGGDHSYAVTVPAVKRFLGDHPEAIIYACGKEEELQSLQDQFKDRVIIVPAHQDIPMDAGPMDVMRLRDSTIMKGLELVKSKEADAIISAGSTGGFLSACTIKLKTMEGVKRAGLMSPFPTLVLGKSCVVLDIGANNENTPEEIVDFALMGKIYAEKVLKINNPQTYLLSNGTEEGKGSPIIKAAGEKLRAMNFPGFQGNTEASSALNGDADVIVCDGFSGNVFLKSSEGVAKWFAAQLKGTFKKNLKGKLAYLLVRKDVKRISQTMNYKELGGAFLMGINGVCVKAHGGSNEEAFYYSIVVAYNAVVGNMLEEMREGIKDAVSAA